MKYFQTLSSGKGLQSLDRRQMKKKNLDESVEMKGRNICTYDHAILN